MMVAAPYDLHASAAGSLAGSQLPAIFLASGLAGIIETSPRGGTIIRRCQCSVTTDTQVPVRSLGAPARPVGGGPPARPPRPWAARSPAPVASISAANRGSQARRMLLDPAPPREAVARPLDARDQQSERGRIAGRFAGHLELVTRLERRSGDLGLGQVVGRTPLQRPGLDRAVLVGHVNPHEGMRIAPHELLHHALDLDLLGRIVGGGERVMREDAIGSRHDGECGEQYQNPGHCHVSFHTPHAGSASRNPAYALTDPLRGTRPTLTLPRGSYTRRRRTSPSSTGPCPCRSARPSPASAWRP